LLWPGVCCSNANLTRAVPQPLGVGDTHAPPTRLPDVPTAHAQPLQLATSLFNDDCKGSAQEAWATSLMLGLVPLRGCSLPLVLACRDIGVEEAVPPDIDFADLRPEDMELASSGSTWSSHWASETPEKTPHTLDLGDTEPPQLVNIRSKVKAVEGCYEHDGRMHNSRPVWSRRMHNSRPMWSKVASSPMHLFFSAKHEKWYISDTFEDNGFTYGIGMALCPMTISWANSTSIMEVSVGKQTKPLRGTSCPPVHSADRLGKANSMRRRVPTMPWAGAHDRKTPPMRQSHSGEAFSEESVGSTASGSSGVRERRGMVQIMVKTEG